MRLACDCVRTSNYNWFVVQNIKLTYEPLKALLYNLSLSADTKTIMINKFYICSRAPFLDDFLSKPMQKIK